MNTHSQALGLPVRRAQVQVDLSAPRAPNKTVEASRFRGKVPHVLFVIDQICQVGGAERILLEMVKRLSPDRFQCSVATFKIDRALDALKDVPCPVHVLPLRRTYDLHAAKMALHLRRLIQAENISIVHTFFETSDLWVGPLAKLSGCPVLISSRRDMGILRARKHKIMYPLMNRLFDRVLAVSEEVRSYCLSHEQLPAERVETLHNGVDLQELDAKSAESDARQNFGLGYGRPVLSTIANIRSVKGIDVLVKAAVRVTKEFPEAVFLVVGRVLEPETFASLQESMESLDLVRNFRFLGALSNPYPVLRASDVFCLPSRNEGFSNALIEAMGCRLPCVATRVGGNGEALEEGKSGFLVPAEDYNAMAERILLLLRNTAMARAMGEAARETVEARFSLQAMVSRLMNIYDELLAAKNV